MRRQHLNCDSRRPAFTLVEIMVVVAIIGVLVALTASAVMQVMSGQQRAATETIVRKVIEAQKKHADQVAILTKQIPVPASVMAMAGGDGRRANVIWLKLQMKRNFPMSYWEAVQPWNYTVSGPNNPGSPLSASDLPPMASYVQALSVVPTAQYGVNPQAEMGAVLLLALRQSRGGETAFNPEEALGAGALVDTNNDGLTKIVDTLGQPLAFYRWPDQNPDMDNSKPGVATGRVSDRDPQDPEGLLMNPAWNNQASYNAKGGVYWFEQLCHLVHDPNNPAAWTPRSFYMLPTVVSAGPNRKLGLDFIHMTPQNNDANDNIYSYQIR
jgi:prepilin-type N-terminal cleavage/methylation domain-containing protein